MKEYSECPNCKTVLKGGLISKVKLLSDSKVKVINEYSEQKSEAYCNKCGDKLYAEFIPKLNEEVDRLSQQIKKIVNTVPIISIHSPKDWNYQVIDMVTGQSTTGTGVITEFTSSFTDIFGVQSGRHNAKIRKGEEICELQLRKKALDLGGNAIIAADIDYSEVGGLKGMLMVCMTGTVVKLKNLDVLDSNRKDKIELLIKTYDKHKRLSPLSTIMEY